MKYVFIEKHQAEFNTSGQLPRTRPAFVLKLLEQDFYASGPEPVSGSGDHVLTYRWCWLAVSGSGH